MGVNPVEPSAAPQGWIPLAGAEGPSLWIPGTPSGRQATA